MSNDEKRKEELRNFLDAMVDDNKEQAQVHFHNYLEDRMKGMVNPQMDVAAELSDGEEEVPATDDVDVGGEDEVTTDED